MMRTCVIYESMFGNTAEIARAVARGLGDVPVVSVDRVNPRELEGLDLIVLGGPTHAFSMTRASTRHEAHEQGAAYGAEKQGLREFIEALPERVSTPVATFDSRAAKARKMPGSAAKAAARDLRRHHGARVVDRQSFYVEDTAGPLVEGELDRAEDWGRRLLHQTTVS